MFTRLASLRCAAQRARNVRPAARRRAGVVTRGSVFRPRACSTTAGATAVRGATHVLAAIATLSAATCAASAASCSGADDLDRQTAAFFEAETAPEGLAQHRASMEDFVRRNIKRGQKVVLVTSGGTTVPLERNTVRFLDNFSTGSRGSQSAEEFARHGYSVIFLHRTGSLRPYFKTARGWADEFVGKGNPSLADRPCGAFTVVEPGVASKVLEYRKLVEEDKIMFVPFTTVTDYLYLLRAGCEALQPAKQQGLVYLAAAVSDFYVPEADMVVHKIQSKGGSGDLVLTLRPVPKMLKLVSQTWCPDALNVSFKLETDRDMLMKKATGSLSKYNMDYVVANLLHERYDRVAIVSNDGVEHVEKAPRETIERSFIRRLVALHTDYLSGHRPTRSL